MAHADELEHLSTLTKTSNSRGNVVVVENETEETQLTKSSCCGSSS